MFIFFIITSFFPINFYAKSAGTNYSYELSKEKNIVMNMKYVPGDTSFPIWSDDSRLITVINSYIVGETELTYGVWKLVYNWAIKNGYKFKNKGIVSKVKAHKDIINDNFPVAWISWFDTIIWCNALTDYYNNKVSKKDDKDDKLDFVYYEILENGTIKPIKKYDPRYEGKKSKLGNMYNPLVADTTGFRLLSGDEWELAARWSNKSENSVNGYEDPYFTKGDSASGAKGGVNKKAKTKEVAWYKYKKLNAFTPPSEVAKKDPNALKIYDMSGNLWEWTFDWCKSGISIGSMNLLQGNENSIAPESRYLGSAQELRMHRGGCFLCINRLLQIGYEHGGPPEKSSKLVGFRIARTVKK